MTCTFFPEAALILHCALSFGKFAETSVRHTCGFRRELLNFDDNTPEHHEESSPWLTTLCSRLTASK
jgi:hypothetical protein